MRTFLFVCAALVFVAPARNAFFDEKCYKLEGKCVRSCQKNEELVAICQKGLKCCLTVQPCSSRKKKRSARTVDDLAAPSSPGLFRRSDLDAGRICGYGTARCRRVCKRQEVVIAICLNTYACCLRKRGAVSLNTVGY